MIAYQLLAFPLLLASAQTTSQSVCIKLTAEFDANEQLYASAISWRENIVQHKRNYGTTLEIMRAEKDLSDTHEKFKSQGDRLVTLLTAHKCSIPDHVTSPFTYRDTDRNAGG